MNPSTTFADKEIILRLLRNVERRTRTHRLTHELTLAFSLVLIIPLTLKAWDLYSPLTRTTVTTAFAVCAVTFAAYAGWRLFRKESLFEAAVSVDEKAALSDEMTTASWFIHHRLSSEWIDAQIQGAARNASNVDLPGLYPRVIPRTSYLAATLFLLFVGLNFVPLSLNHNWLKLQAAPAGVLSQPIDLLQSIKEGLEEMAKDLQQSDKTKDTADALMQKQLRKAAEELRKLSEQMKNETSDSEESMERMQQSLQQASKKSKPGLEKLSKSMAKASEGLKSNDQQTTQEALEQAAKELENLEQKMREQEMKNQDGPQRQVRQRPSPSRPGSGQPQRHGEGGESRQASDKKSDSESNGTGQDPNGNPPRQGDRTTLEVQLELERLAGMPSGGGVPEDIHESSRQQLSKLDYRNVKSELSAGQKDLMNQDGIPWEYRPLVKDYLQAIRPR